MHLGARWRGATYSRFNLKCRMATRLQDVERRARSRPDLALYLSRVRSSEVLGVIAIVR